MNDKEKLENWKRKLVETENKVRKLSNQRDLLIKQKLNFSLKDLNLEEDISHLKDWIEFYNGKILEYKNKIETFAEETSQQEFGETRDEDKSNTKEENPEDFPTPIKDAFKLFDENVKSEKSGVKAEEKKTVTKEIRVGDKEISEDEIFDQELEDLDKEARTIVQKEKELVHVGSKETPDVELSTPEELEKDTEKEDIKVEVNEELKLDLKDLEEDARMKSGTHSEGKVELEKPEFIVAGPQQEDEKELVAVTKLFEERPEIKAVREQIKELFKDKKDIVRPSRFKESLDSFRKYATNALESAKTSANNGFEALKSIDKKYVVYTVPILLLLLTTGILFISKPEITGYVTLEREKTYIDDLNLVINESGNYTWTIDEVGDIKSIMASGKIKGNGSVKIYIEKDGQRYLIYDNKESK